MNPVLKGYLRLARPANLPTAAADILAGTAIAGIFTELPLESFLTIHLLFLIGSTICLYAGGVVLNDVFDAELDKIERPERPIPSGLIKLNSARTFGGILLMVGIILAFLVNNLCGSVALILAFAILSYDIFAKKNGVLGPLNMGICRGLNLLLGMAIVGVINQWWLAIIPIFYIAAITLISRGEVHGDNKKHIILAGAFYASVIVALLFLIIFNNLNTLQALPFLILFAFLIFRPLINAYQSNSPENIKKAVIAGVLSLIVLDATIVVGFSEWWLGILTILLFPLSIYLSKLFAVT